MESENSRNNQVSEKSKENLETFIVDTLLKGQKIEIPDYGYLELRSLSGKSTVLFKAANLQNSSIQQPFYEWKGGDQESVFQEVISIPLKAGEVVSLPKLGTFRPIKQADGTFRLSFTMSSSLRKQLNGELVEEGAKSEASTSNFNAPEEKITPIVSFERTVIENNKLEVSSDLSPSPSPEVVSPKEITPIVLSEASPIIPKERGPIISPKKELEILPREDKEDIEFQDEIFTRGKKKSPWRRFIFIIFFCILIALSFYYLNEMREREEQQPNASIDHQPSQSLSLLDLAEQHYGNSVFWVYIYDANRSKLSSPLNIPKGVTLTIPDLSQSEYKVDVKDSLEIQRAKIKSENILKQK